MRDLRKGFTLIELLVVMAILGILAVIVLLAINPTEQLSKANDSGRISAVNQLGHQVQSFYTSRTGVYPDADNWDEELTNTNDLSSFPTGIDYNSSNGVEPCETNPKPEIDPTFCYEFDTANGALIYTRLESKLHRSKCADDQYAYFAYSTGDGRAGIICAADDPSPWAPGSQTYIQ